MYSIDARTGTITDLLAPPTRDAVLAARRDMHQGNARTFFYSAKALASIGMLRAALGHLGVALRQREHARQAERERLALR